MFIYLLNKYYKSENLELYGVDKSNIAIEVAKKKSSNSTFNISDVYKLPFEENSFDIVISSDVIEHVLKPKIMLSEIKRVGKKNSFIIIGTPIRYTENPRDNMHQCEFFPKEFMNLLSEFFVNLKLIQSQKMSLFLLYNSSSFIFNRKRMLYRYIINLLTIYLKRNPFLKIKTEDNNIYSYMFAIGTIKK